MSIYKVDAIGDTMYIQAESQEEAQEKLFETTGEIPEGLLSWSIVNKLPKGEELL